MRRGHVLGGIIFLGVLLVLAFLIVPVFTGNVVSEESTSKTTTYIYGGNLLASVTDNGTEYYVQDHLGSNRKVVGEQEAEFYAFGEAANEPAEGNDYLYTGKEKDSESGLYYYGARYYAPELGRFVAADALTGSLQDPLSMNRYSYVKNNPLKYVDPTGNAGNPADATYVSSTIQAQQSNPTWNNRPNWGEEGYVPDIGSSSQATLDKPYQKGHYAKPVEPLTSWWTFNDGYGAPADHFALLSMVVIPMEGMWAKAGGIAIRGMSPTTFSGRLAPATGRVFPTVQSTGESFSAEHTLSQGTTWRATRGTHEFRQLLQEGYVSSRGALPTTSEGMGARIARHVQLHGTSDSPFYSLSTSKKFVKNYAYDGDFIIKFRPGMQGYSTPRSLGYGYEAEFLKTGGYTLEDISRIYRLDGGKMKDITKNWKDFVP